MKPELEDTLAAPAATSAAATVAASSPESSAVSPVASGDRTATVDGKSRAPRGDGLELGQRLGHFRIDRPLGAGGMGEVYLATDLALDRPVAVKVLPAATAGDTSRRDRLVREARAQARVVHPNVGHIYFIGEDNGRLYFAMEYVAGRTLAERIADGPLAIDEAISVIRSAARGLREAQRLGFTHRDVKPSNLMVDSHGVVKVLDFGLAAGDATTGENGPVAQTSLAGTPLYMAPEQGRGQPVDFRSDIYALGATLYHLVSGDPPFKADSADALLSLHASAARPVVPRGKRSRTRVAAVDSLVSKMMAQRPEDRFQSYDELLDAIEIASAEHTRPAGFWARSIATGIDLLLVGFLGALITLVVDITSSYELTHDDLIIFPLFLFYEAACVRRWGKTLGKSLFELEVVSIYSQHRPSWRQSIIRALGLGGVQIVLMFVGSLLKWLDVDLAAKVVGIIAAVTFPLWLFVLLFAAWRTPGKRAPWDRISGTIVRYHTPRPTAPA